MLGLVGCDGSGAGRGASDEDCPTRRSGDLCFGVAHIESEKGYTYNYMKVRRELEMDGGKYGIITPEKVLFGVRMEANGLIKNGCTPRWLDEFK